MLQLYGLQLISNRIYISRRVAGNMVKKKKITSMIDYFNPKYLAVVRRCNILYKKAKGQYRKKEWGEAISKYEEFLKLNTADFASFMEIAVSYCAIGKEREAIYYLKSAKKLKRGPALLDFIETAENAQVLKPEDIRFLKKNIKEIIKMVK